MWGWVSYWINLDINGTWRRNQITLNKQKDPKLQTLLSSSSKLTGFRLDKHPSLKSRAIRKWTGTYVWSDN